jgi:tetratricopeptide (TPR) repeat protein
MQSKQTKMFDNFFTRLFGCWHRKMSRPFQEGEETYSVCIDCGARRQYDIKRADLIGPYYYVSSIKPDPVSSTALIKRTDKGDLQLLVQAAESGDLATLKALAVNNVQVNARGEKGVTALMRAASNGHTEVVKYLIEKGAALNVRKNNGLTPLMHAAFFGHYEVVKVLLDRGADRHAKDIFGMTASRWAAFRGHSQIVQLIETTPEFVKTQDALAFYTPSLPQTTDNDSTDIFKPTLDVKFDNVTYFNQGMMYCKTRQWKEAADYFRKALSQNPEWARAHLMLGVAYLCLGEELKALDQYNKLRQLDIEAAEKLNSLFNKVKNKQNIQNIAYAQAS